MKDTPKGKVRLAFRGNKVVEAKSMADRLTDMKAGGKFKKRRKHN